MANPTTFQSGLTFATLFFASQTMRPKKLSLENNISANAAKRSREIGILPARTGGLVPCERDYGYERQIYI